MDAVVIPGRCAGIGKGVDGAGLVLGTVALSPVESPVAPPVELLMASKTAFTAGPVYRAADAEGGRHGDLHHLILTLAAVLDGHAAVLSHTVNSTASWVVSCPEQGLPQMRWEEAVLVPSLKRLHRAATTVPVLSAMLLLRLVAASAARCKSPAPTVLAG